ncbi:MAG TPA: PIN domain-containing protein [Terriglobales bacterium]|nr:PIN domain-containing protein [Terriglobales bacterium]
MKTFFDTSVLVSAVLASHEHHERSLVIFAKSDRKTGCCAAHTLAELYSTLTRMPGKQRIVSDQALLFLDEVEERLELIHLNAREYRLAINEAARHGVVGGTIYDALLGQCAVKAGATRILTWDVAHFQLLGPEIAGKVQTP